MRFEQGRLHPRRVIFLELRDLLEQRRAAHVVEEASRQTPRPAREALQYGLSEIRARRVKPWRGRGRRSVEIFDEWTTDVSLHQASPASRKPMNCQRWSG